MASIFLLLVANLGFIGFCMWKGRAAMKEDIAKAKKRRKEQEEKEEEEEKRRQQEEDNDDFERIQGGDGPSGAGYGGKKSAGVDAEAKYAKEYAEQ